VSSESVTAKILPKCYEDVLGELAGEVIEYCWGAAKQIYRKLPLHQKKSWESFRKSVGVCLSKMNIEMCRQFWGMARGYLLGHHHQALEAKDRREKVKSFGRNEKIQKIYRSHRDALTFSGEFISQGRPSKPLNPNFRTNQKARISFMLMF
jgi:hypothetical protein